MFSGGADVDPSLYGAEPHPETDTPQARRDAGELALLEAALERDMPTLAICRGFQLLNIARGGDLVQHLPDEVGQRRAQAGSGRLRAASGRGEGRARGWRRWSALAPTSRRTTTRASDASGEGLVEAAWAGDGTLEGVEDPSRRFLVGVQWHPEAGEDAALFESLVEEAREYRAPRRKR